MTNDELEAVRARAEAATAGPWEWHWDAILGQWNLAPGVLLADGTDGTPGGDKIDVENATFIAHARTDIPALLDEVERLRGDAHIQRNFWQMEDALARAEAHAERLAGALEAMVAERHFHQAQPTGDGCEFCGKDLRDTIHYSCGETGSTDRARAMLALSAYNQRTET